MARSRSFFRRQLRFALRRDFADENIAGFHFRADANHAVRPEVAQRFFTDVRNVPRDFFRAELGIARADLKFIDVNRGVDVFLHDLFRDHDGVFEVVAVPGHERDEHVASQRQFALIRIRAVGNDLAPLHVLALLHDRLLVHAGARVRAHELPQLVNVNAGIEIRFQFLSALWHVTILRHDDLIRCHRSDLAAFGRDQDRVRIARNFAFQARSRRAALPRQSTEHPGVACSSP